LNEVRTGDKVRASIRTKCGNMEEGNKYWIENNYRVCVYSMVGQDKIEHYYIIEDVLYRDKRMV